MNKYRYYIGALLILSTSAFGVSYDNFVSGTITYYDQDLQATVPLKNVFIALETQTPTILTNGLYPTTYTDNSGHYSFNIGANEPEQVTIRVYFSNEYLKVQSLGGTRSDYTTYIGELWVDCNGTGQLPDCFGLGKNVTIDVDYSNQSDEADFAKVFAMGTHAGQYAEANGFQISTPLNIKYPAEECLVESQYLEVTSAFFWPFEEYSTDDLGFWGSVVGFLESEATISENAIYLPRATAAAGRRVTIFHEYAHFLMKMRRNGNWPISLLEYTLGVEEQTHTWVDYDQSPRLAFIEGWANFYASAVESELAGSQYSGRYNHLYILNNVIYVTVLNTIFEDAHNFNSSNVFRFDNVTSGYLNEVTVGAAFFDLYDPATGGDADGYEGSLSEIAAVMALGDNYFSSYMSSYFNQADMDDHDAIANILTTLKMTIQSDSYITLSNQTITTTETFVATNSITAGPAFTVESGADVILDAGNSIRLLPGFHAKAGSHFRASVGYVPPTPQPPTAPGGLYIVNETSLGGNPFELIEALYRNPQIDYVDFDLVYEFLGTPSDPLYSTQYNMPRIDME